MGEMDQEINGWKEKKKESEKGSKIIRKKLCDKATVQIEVIKTQRAKRWLEENWQSREDAELQDALTICKRKLVYRRLS